MCSLSRSRAYPKQEDAKMDIENENDLEVKEAQPDYTRTYTIEEYYKIREDIRAELYEGHLVVMESTTIRHQRVSGEIFGPLWQFLKGKRCEVFMTPGVRLFEKEQSVFLPDIIVVCNETKLGKRSCNGAPDFVVEILSPSTARMDKKLKYGKYEKAGVKEYWIVDPEKNLVEANILANDKYVVTIYTDTDKAPVHILDDFEIDLADVFAD